MVITPFKFLLAQALHRSYSIKPFMNLLMKVNIKIKKINLLMLSGIKTMNTADTQYLTILRELLNKGVKREGRNGNTYGLFGAQMRFDLQQGFPLLTTKKLYTKAIIGELLWFLRGETNIKALVDDNIHIWDEWADKDGELGPVYGSQWRSWTVFDADR